MSFGFTALFTRMNYIDRWGLMRNARRETLAEHSAVTACVAHVLATAARDVYGAEVRPETVATAALYHDMSETLTGDMPTPVKYANDDIRTSYKKVEREAEQSVCRMLPPELRESMAGYITGEGLNEREGKIVKAADKLSALIKCIEERRSGNREFESAEAATLASIQEMDLPELRYFIGRFLPGYSMTLDELMNCGSDGEIR